MTTNQAPRKTPLCDEAVSLGGRIVDFHGWLLPVQFAGILKEHQAVRNACGIFDVSHMGQVFVSGPDAHKFLQFVNANDVKETPGRGVYSHVLNERGGLVDDVIVFCRAKDSFLVVVNAATTEKDFAWFQSRSAGFNVQLKNASPDYGMIAFQGPKAPEIIAKFWPEAAKIARFGIIQISDFFIVRTGYTGEDGCEIIAPAASIAGFWKKLISAGAVPCGLGARDTLRLEAGYLLYGQDVDDDRTSYEANYGWVVKLKKGEFFGKAALMEKIKAGFREKLTGFVLAAAGVPRGGCAVFRNGEKIGSLASATFSPVLGKGIGVGYVSPPDLKEGEPVEIEIHGKRAAAVVAKTPFYDNKV